MSLRKFLLWTERTRKGNFFVQVFHSALLDSVFLSRQTWSLSCLCGGWGVNSSSVLTGLFRGADVCLLSSRRGGMSVCGGSPVRGIVGAASTLRASNDSLPAFCCVQTSEHRSGARWILISCACRTFNYKAGNRCYSQHIWHSHKNE